MIYISIFKGIIANIKKIIYKKNKIIFAGFVLVPVMKLKIVFVIPVISAEIAGTYKKNIKKVWLIFVRVVGKKTIINHNINYFNKKIIIFFN